MEYIHQGVVKIIALDYRNSFFLHNFIVLFLHSTVYIRGPKPSFPVLLPGWLSFPFLSFYGDECVFGYKPTSVFRL